MLHVSPETNGTGEILPHTLVFPDTLFTLADKRVQTVLLDLLLAVQPQCLLDLQLYRKSVGIPAGLSRYHIALHGAVSRNHILDDAGQHMADMGLAVGCRRSVVEGIGLAFLAAVHALLEDMVFIPELFNLFLTTDEIQVGGYFLVHVFFLLLRSLFILFARISDSRAASEGTCAFCEKKRPSSCNRTKADRFCETT